MRKLACGVLAAAVSLGSWGCSDSGADPVGSAAGGSSQTSSGGSGGAGQASNPDAEPDGMLVYWMPQPDGNTFACGTCHALEEPAGDAMRRAGHQLGDATERPSFKNGQLDTLLEAVNSCLKEWMLVPEPWTADTPRWQALEAFLQEQNDGSEAPAVSFEIVAPSSEPADFEGGDADAGQELFNASCSLCHGENATGTERAPAIDASLWQDPDMRAPYIATRVRTSGFAGSDVYDGLTGGRMPFWSADRLSDQELKDLILYLLSKDDTGSTGPMNMPTQSGMRTCDSTHEKVGQVATLMTNFHGVGGTATIVDDCTIQIENFTFDGGGINVQVYGATMRQYGMGFSLSDNLVGSPFQGVELTVQLPEEKTLDDLDGISVWCVPVGVNFGSGEFAAP